MFRTLTLLSLLAIAGLTIEAQGRIEGVLYDSTRTQRPLQNAEVVLLGSGRSATTDRRGRFTFSDVPAGVQRVAYAALWLDSVGQPVVIRSVTVPTRGRASLRIATKSLAAIQRAECGSEFARDIGLLVGEVRDADEGGVVANVRVEARWIERHLGRGVNELRTVATVDTSDSNGRYALCGVPVAVQVSLFAEHRDGRRVDTLQTTVSSQVGAVDLTVGRGDRRIVVAGRVVGPTGNPMPRANLVASLSADRPLETDSTGRFRVSVPARSGQLFVRTLGYQPQFVEFAPTGEIVDVGDIALRPVGAVLDTRIITARPRTREEAEFNQRKLMGTGAFLDSADMALWPRISAGMIAVSTKSWVRAVTVSGSGGRQLPFSTITLRSHGRVCRPAVWVDGFRWGTLDPIDEHNILQHAKRIEIHREAFAPPQFVDAANSCGALVIWTR